MNTDNLCLNDRASVLKIIEGWNNPTVLSLEEAKMVRRVEASPERQAGRRSIRAILDEIASSVVEPPFPPLNFAGLLDEIFNLQRRRQESGNSGSWLTSNPDPFAGTFVRGGWRRRRIYPAESGIRFVMPHEMAGLSHVPRHVLSRLME